MKKFFVLKIFIIILFMLTVKTYGWELDMSVDDEIKRKYDTSAIEDNLPTLPSIEKSGKTSSKTSTSVPDKQLIYTDEGKNFGKVKSLPVKIDGKSEFSAVKIKKGSKFIVKSNSTISDSLPEGRQVSFTTQQDVTQRYITIPAGTKIYGIIEDSHLPQITGNGGLIEIKITSMVINGSAELAGGKVVRANGKKIFFNNIKGKRGYLKNILTCANKGKPFYNKTRQISGKLNGNPFTGLISPFVSLTGSVVYATTILVSPATAIFTKGSRISIPQGAVFVLKLTDDVFIDL